MATVAQPGWRPERQRRSAGLLRQSLELRLDIKRHRARRCPPDAPPFPGRPGRSSWRYGGWANHGSSSAPDGGRRHRTDRCGPTRAAAMPAGISLVVVSLRAFVASLRHGLGGQAAKAASIASSKPRPVACPSQVCRESLPSLPLQRRHRLVWGDLGEQRDQGESQAFSCNSSSAEQADSRTCCVMRNSGAATGWWSVHSRGVFEVQQPICDGCRCDSRAQQKDLYRAAQS